MNEAVKELKTLLEPLAAKMGQAGEYVFELAIRQNYVNAIHSIIFIIGVIIAGILYRKFFKYANTILEEEQIRRWSTRNGEWMPPVLVLLGLGLGLLGVVALAEVGTVIGRLINPEWYAINDLINMVRGE